MVKNTEERDVSEGRTLGVGQALEVLGSTPSIVWKAAVFYTLWIGLTYLAMTNASTLPVVQLSAIAYWFGWLFFVMTALLGVFIVVTSLFNRRRLAVARRKD